MHALNFHGYLYVAYRKHTETDDVTAHLPCRKATLHRLLEGFSFSNLPSIFGNNWVLQPLADSSQNIKFGGGSPLTHYVDVETVVVECVITPR